MADLLRYLHDTGGIVEDGGTWVLARDACRRCARDLPESVQAG